MLFGAPEFFPRLMYSPVVDFGFHHALFIVTYAFVFIFVPLCWQVHFVHCMHHFCILSRFLLFVVSLSLSSSDFMGQMHAVGDSFRFPLEFIHTL